MWIIAQGIPNLPDLTHPNELIEFGNQMLRNAQVLAILVGVVGIAIALIGFSLHRMEVERASWVNKWLERYDLLLGKLLHAILVIALLVGGFYLCSTLANRYHNWEQARLAKAAFSVAGERMEQPAPQVRYVIQEPYTYDTVVEDRVVRVQKTRPVNRFLTLSSSQIEVKIDQVGDPQKEGRYLYSVNYSGDYKVTNPFAQTQSFFFEVQPPKGYLLLQNFKVEQNGTRLVPVNPGDYGFPFNLEPGQEAKFRVTYKAQGGPRWVYNANGQLLSKFRLNVLANFPNADFASGIIPTLISKEGGGTQFTWVFDDNVSVRNPFGVFTSSGAIRNTGILPRLLILAPAVFLWWILMLYLSLPMSLKDVALAGGVFFACLLALTYLSRIVDVKDAWGGISLFMLVLVWGLGSNWRASLAAVIATIAGCLLPVFGLLIPYSGITLSIAGILSVLWLAVRHWYGWYQIDRKDRKLNGKKDQQKLNDGKEMKVEELVTTEPVVTTDEGTKEDAKVDSGIIEERLPE